MYVCVCEVHCVAAMVKSVCVVLQMNSHNCYTLVCVYLQTHLTIHFAKYLVENADTDVSCFF